jgi:hypothetical protein
MWNPTTYEQLLEMMDKYPPPLDIPVSRKDKETLTDTEVLTICGYWFEFDARLDEYFENARMRRLIAGWICEPWFTQDRARCDFYMWLDSSGTGDRLGLVKTSGG